jgi:hypothetical protein
MIYLTEEIFNEPMETGTKFSRTALAKELDLNTAEIFCQHIARLLYPGDTEQQILARCIFEAAAGYTFMKCGEQMSIKEFIQMQVKENLKRALNHFIGENDD